VTDPLLAGIRTMRRMRSPSPTDLVCCCRFGSPRELMAARGTFYDMVRHSGEGEELKRLIKDTCSSETDLLDS
jgi:hypothetical protein